MSDNNSTAPGSIPRALWIDRSNLLPALAGLAEAVNNGGDSGGCVLVDPELIVELGETIEFMLEALAEGDANTAIREARSLGALLTEIPEPPTAEKGAA
jgi:hypothetical protein